MITIVTITYNPGDLLEKTIDNILSQTCHDFEYIIVDGSSNDGTVDVIRKKEIEIKSKSIDFKWISEPDKGIYDAMNKGLKMASRKYVWFINAGDLIADKNVVQKVYEKIGDSNPDFIYGETNIVDINDNIIGKRRLKAPEYLTWKSFKWGMLVCHQSMIVKKSIAPLYDLKYKHSADVDWSIKCLKNSKEIYNTHLVLSHFLEGGDSHVQMKASLKERFEIMSNNYGFVSTFLRHIFFIFRAVVFKLIHGWI